MSLTLVCVAYTALAFLALSMDRHHLAACGTRPAPRRRWRLRVAGWFLLALALVDALLVSGFAHGLVTWFAVLSCTGLMLSVLLHLRASLWHLPALLLGSIALPVLLF